MNFSDEELSIFYKKIGSNVKEARKEKNFTQMELEIGRAHV